MKTSPAATAKGRVPANETATFCAQAAMLLRAGIPLHEGLAALTEEGTSTGRALLSRIAAVTAETGSLYEAVKATGVFPAYMVNMIHVGETVGKLEDVLDALSVYYEREGKLRSAIRSAVLYPAVLILLMAAVIAVLVVAVLPVFSQVLDSLGADVVGGSGLMTIGVTIGRVALIVVAVVLALLLVLLIVSLIPVGRAWLLRVSARLPVLRGLYARLAAGRFAAVIALMLSSGYPLEEALGLSEDVVSDPAVRDKIARCREKVGSGLSFSAALTQLHLFPGLHGRLIQTGEKAGRLDEVMQQTARRYEEELDDSLSALVAFIEPTLVMILSVIIGGILLSVMLPLISILSLIG